MNEKAQETFVAFLGPVPRDNFFSFHFLSTNMVFFSS